MQLVVAGVVIGVVVLATALLSSDRMEAFLQRSTGMVNGRFKDTPADRVPDDEGVTPWGRAQQDINSSEPTGRAAAADRAELAIQDRLPVAPRSASGRDRPAV